MRKTIWEKRIPTLLGIFFIGIGIAVTTLLVKQGVIFVGKAAPTYTPREVRITNVTDSALTISYFTDDKIVGSINYGKDQKLGQVARDERDQQSGTLTSYKIHNITLRNLSPLTKYYFSITNGDETFLNNNVLFQASTGAVINSPPPDQNPISGKVIMPDGTSPKEAIIFMAISGSQTISTLLKDDGSYFLPLNSLRTDDPSNYFNFSDQNIKMQIIGDDSSESNIIVSLGETSPVPTVTLSKDYDFTLNFEPIASSSGQLGNFPSVSEKTTTGNEPSILSPTENESFTDQQPLFKGTSLPNSTIEIVIHSDNGLTTQVQSDANGNWSYRPDSILSPGAHTITITAKDSSGILRVITQNFIVYASGTQVSESATPSATPVVTASPTPTSVLTATPTVIPTITPTPELIPTSSITPTITPTIGVIKTPTPTLPPTGNSAVNFGILGLVVALLGGLLFLLARGSVSFL